MSVLSLCLTNFTVFEKAALNFASGINLFLGTNGTGKTHAMKVLYSVLTSTNQAGGFAEKLSGVFKPDEGAIEHLRRKGLPISVEVKGTDYSFSVKVRESAGVPKVSGWNLRPAALYLPSREVLAMYEGFFAAYRNRELSFDETYFDACTALNAKALRGPAAERMAPLKKAVEQMLGGKVSLVGDRFYVTFKGEGKLEAHLLAEGLRKLGCVARLIENGSLREGVLFWDEPEANLNPTLIVKIADLLLDLSEAGVQIFAATHDYLLASRLSLISEYDRRPKVPIRFFSFCRDGAAAPVQVASGKTLSELPSNSILDEFARHYDFERRLFDESFREGGE